MKRTINSADIAALPKSSIVALWNDMADGDNPPLTAKKVGKDDLTDLAQKVYDRATELGYVVLETDGGIELIPADEVGDLDTDAPSVAFTDAALDEQAKMSGQEAAEIQDALDNEPIDPTEDNEPVADAPQPGAAAFLAAQGVTATTPVAGKPAKAKRGFTPSPEDQRRIKLLQPLNPKRGKSATRYAQYRNGMTIAEYISACVSRGLVESGTHCRADILWDTSHGFIEVLPPAVEELAEQAAKLPEPVAEGEQAAA